jgi:hypothetical protein
LQLHIALSLSNGDKKKRKYQHPYLDDKEIERLARYFRVDGYQFFKHFSKRLALIDDLNADEGNVIALHHNGVSWEDRTGDVNEGANTVTCKVSSLSSFTTDVSEDDEDDGVTRGGDRSNGGGVAAETFPPGYFELNPLAKIQIRSSIFLNAAGVGIFQAQAGQQISLFSLFRNVQQSSQNYMRSLCRQSMRTALPPT